LPKPFKSALERFNAIYPTPLYCFQHATASKLYSYFGNECFLHLSKVAAGFDSAIMAETEIQGQVKQAYELALKAKTLPSCLHSLFQKSLQISKHIRSKYALGRGMPDIEHAVFQTGTHYFKTPQEKSILFIGSSAINQKVLGYIQKKGCKSITLCNRTQENAEKLSLKFQIPSLPFAAIDQWQEFDWIILGTNAPNYLIHENNSISQPKLIIDLSLPRNADPRLAQDPNVQLLNIDQINRMLKFRRKWIDSTFTQAHDEITTLVLRHTHLLTVKQTKIQSLAG
jgi:glutamyl-tRNA reductase